MSSRPRRQHSAAHSVRRAPIIAVLATALVAGGLVDRAAGAPRARAVPSVDPVPVAAPADALSSSWFCAGATNSNWTIPGSVVIADDGPRAVAGQVTLVSSTGGSRRVPVRVGPYSSLTLPESMPGALNWVGAIVDLEGGSVAVEQAVDGGSALGRSVAPCATSASSRWYFPTGQTRVNAGEDLLLLNPYPTAVIADLSFSTDQGQETPVDYQGITVPAGGLVSVDLGSHLRRRAYIAATVSVRNGSVVAWETSWVTPPPPGAPLVGTPAGSGPLADPALPVAGVALTLGAPSAGTHWSWPDGLAGKGIDEQYVVYNPSPAPAEVRLSVGLAQGAAEPFSFAVGPGQVVPVVSEQQARIPAGVPHTATLVSVNGTPVVAARTLTVDLPAVSGIASLLGARLAAPAWIVAGPASDASHGGQVVLGNPGPLPVRARLLQLAGAGEVPVAGIATLSIPARGRVAVALPLGQQAPVVVRAAGPVYVEYNMSGVAGTGGVSLSFAVPLS